MENVIVLIVTTFIIMLLCSIKNKIYFVNKERNMVMKKLTSLVLGSLMALSLVMSQSAKAEDLNVLLLVDGSGSMEDPLGSTGQQKMDVSKKVLKQFVNKASNMSLGFRVYSATSGDCDDTQNLISVAPLGDKTKFLRAIGDLEPNGKTPLAYSIEQGINDFRGGKEKVMVIVTDGLETCDGDPCAAATKAKSYGITVHVIAVGLGDEEDATLRCVATNGGGKFYSADTIPEFETAIKEVAKTVDVDLGEFGKCVDWTKRAIEATGTGAPNANMSSAQATLMAQRAAQADAYRQISECVFGVKVDSTTTVQNFVTTDDTINTKVSGLIKGAKVVGKKQNQDGTWEVTVQITVEALEAALGKKIPQTLN